MASKNPPVKNAAFTFRLALFAQSDNQVKTTPTIAAGDFKVSTDGGALANPATLPSESPAGSGMVLVSLSAAEMNGDEVVLKFADASGDEWHSGVMVLHTIASGKQFDDLSTLTAAQVNAEADQALADYDALTVADIQAGTLDIAINSLEVVATTGQAVSITSPDNTAVQIISNGGVGMTISGTVVGARIGNSSNDIGLEIIGGQIYGLSIKGDQGDIYLENDGGKLPEAVWGNATRTLTSFGTLVADIWGALTSGMVTVGSIGKYITDNLTAGGISGLAAAVWAYATRTLTANVNGVTIVSAVSGNAITVYEYATWAFTLTDSALALTDYENLIFVVKGKAYNLDSEAVLLVDITTGLIRIGGAAPTAANLGSVVKDSATSFTVLVAMSEVAAKIAGRYAGGYTWQLKGIDTGDDPDQGFVLIEGSFTIKGGRARAIT